MIRLLFIFFVPVCFLSACTKQNIPAGSDAQESVYFIYSMGFGGLNNFDSLNYSFVGKSDAVKMDTIWLTVRTSGRTADHDRTIDLSAVGAGTTAVQGVHYKLLPY